MLADLLVFWTFHLPRKHKVSSIKGTCVMSSLSQYQRIQHGVLDSLAPKVLRMYHLAVSPGRHLDCGIEGDQRVDIR